MIPRIFEGEAVIILGGGPSLKALAPRLPELLKNRNVIAINRSLAYAPNAAVLWWTDAKFWRNYRADILAHPARWKATSNYEYDRKELPVGIEQYLITGAEGFDENPEHIRHGWTSSYAATHLAIHLGAKTIILLGVDLRHDPNPGGETIHPGYAPGPLRDEAFALWRKAFAGLVPILARKGVEVINGSHLSAITQWPKMSPEDALSLMDRRAIHG